MATLAIDPSLVGYTPHPDDPSPPPWPWGGRFPWPRPFPWPTDRLTPSLGNGHAPLLGSPNPQPSYFAAVDLAASSALTAVMLREVSRRLPSGEMQKSLTTAVDKFVDDWCGTPWPKRWPRPRPQPWPHPFEAAIDRLKETTLVMPEGEGRRELMNVIAKMELAVDKIA